MYVVKRDGSKEAIKFDKITARIVKMCYGLDPLVSPEAVTMKVIESIFDGITTTGIDNLAAEVAITKTVEHPDYGLLASRIAVSNLHKETKSNFSEVMNDLYNYIDPITGENAALLSDEVHSIVMGNQELFDSSIVYDRDFKYDYFGFKTLCRSYLMKLDSRIVERPQQMLMRVSVGIHKNDINAVLKTYNLMSEGWFTHASPTLFNAGTAKPQLSSGFLMTNKEDSIDGIYDTLKSCAQISQLAGGIGLAIHEVRAKGAYIKGSSGVSNGIIPMLKVFNNTAKYVDQGGGKRKGSFAIYLEPWHADVCDFLDLKKNHGKEEQRARDLSYALWIPDLFMKRVQENGDWTLMCPYECPGLSDVHSELFEALYTKYEKAGKGRETIKAQDLWFKILETQIETGMPYMLYKDSANKKSNQQNLGVVKTSNLCAEIVAYSAPDEVPACPMASLSLPKFINEQKCFDFDELFKVSYHAALNLNKVIDNNYYPIEEAQKSNVRHRPIGLGIQGLADAFILMGFPFESEEAKSLNQDIFETIYFAAMTASKDLAKKYGYYDSFPESPVSKGLFQYDLWGVKPTKRWEWSLLKEEVKKYGIRNSLLIATMPTYSTAQVLGNSPCFEPYTSNVSTRRINSGEFIDINKYLQKDLVGEGLWSSDMRTQIMANNGSIQNIEGIPQRIKNLYKTAWEIPQTTLINQAADRGAFICQSQSLNIFLENANFGKLTAAHFHAWKKGLKTGMFHLKTKASTGSIKFNINKTDLHKTIKSPEDSNKEFKIQNSKNSES